MKVPKVHGVIGRRLLVNFRVEPEVIQRQLPDPVMTHECFEARRLPRTCGVHPRVQIFRRLENKFAGVTS